MILLDTCVVSELAKPLPDPVVVGWLDSLPETALFLSVLTLGEIQKGAALLDPGPRRQRVEAWLEQLQQLYGDRILSVDQETALCWGRLCAESRRMGQLRPPVDSLLAATALRYGLSLATRNVADFEGTGARVINPWGFGA